ncbi:MAG: hypothetical protein QXY94_06225 [Archaeoglobaceae archaeon]
MERAQQERLRLVNGAAPQVHLRHRTGARFISLTPDFPVPPPRGDPFVETAVQILKFLVELTEIRRRILTAEISSGVRALLLNQTDALIARVVADAGRVTPKLRKPAKESKKTLAKISDFWRIIIHLCRKAGLPLIRVEEFFMNLWRILIDLRKEWKKLKVLTFKEVLKPHLFAIGQNNKSPPTEAKTCLTISAAFWFASSVPRALRAPTFPAARASG